MTNYLFNQHNVRLTLVTSNPGAAYNWLFLPGGPGMDSSYLTGLAKSANLPGNIWLIDLPGSGSHHADNPNYDNWDNIFIDCIKSFEKPILVGHSFGGMYPLLFPELENILSGLVILSSAPSLWLEAAAKVAEERNLPALDAELSAMQQNPTLENATKALLACAPYYFKPTHLEAGKALLHDAPFQCHAANWWFARVMNDGFDAKWAPERIPTLIIGAEYDSITPFELYENDKRFQRDNIELTFIEDAGHMPWLEQPEAVITRLNRYAESLTA